MLLLLKHLALLFYLQKEPQNVQIQNVSIGQPSELHEKCGTSPQKKLLIQPDAGRDSAVNAVLSPAARLHCEVVHDAEGQTPVGVFEK